MAVPIVSILGRQVLLRMRQLNLPTFANRNWVGVRCQEIRRQFRSPLLKIAWHPVSGRCALVGNCHGAMQQGEPVFRLPLPTHSVKASTSAFNFFKPPTSLAQPFTFRIVVTGSLFPVAVTFSTMCLA